MHLSVLLKKAKINQSQPFLDFTRIWQTTTNCFPYDANDQNRKRNSYAYDFAGAVSIP